MTVIHTYNFYSGGIGDLLRSVFAYFVYCKLNDIEYYFVVSDNHPFSRFFIKDPKALNIDTKDAVSFVDLTGTCTVNTKHILDSIKHKGVYVITSNVFNFIDFDTLNKYRESFLEFLKISDIVKHRIEELKPIHPFNSIHLRLGDAYMDSVNISSDIRYKGSFEKDIKNVCTFLKNEVESNAVSTEDIYLFTDSNKIKLLNLDIKMLKTKIHHSALPVHSTASEDSSFLDSLVEFFILGSSNKIVSMSNSGYSFWSSFIFNVPLYKLSNCEITKFNWNELNY